MRNLFNPDAAVWRFMAFIGDLVLLNLLFILTSIPIITMGASISALSSVEYKLIEKRIDFIVKNYFRAFKENFLNSTVIWVVYLVFLVVCLLNFNAVYHTNPSYRNVLMVVLGIALFLITMTVMYSLAMQARFVNTLLDTVVKGFMIGLSGLPYTFVMLLMIIACVGLSIQTIGSILYSAPFWILIGFSGIGYLCNIMYLRVFKKVTASSDLPKDQGFIERETYHDGDRKRSSRRKARQKR